MTRDLCIVAWLVVLLLVAANLLHYQTHIVYTGFRSPFVVKPDPPYTLDDDDEFKSDCQPDAYHPYQTGCAQRELNVI
jgi:hypothetical protein